MRHRKFPIAALIACLSIGLYIGPVKAVPIARGLPAISSAAEDVYPAGQSTRALSRIVWLADNGERVIPAERDHDASNLAFPVEHKSALIHSCSAY
jgi:hypothetical protein